MTPWLDAKLQAIVDAAIERARPPTYAEAVRRDAELQRGGVDRDGNPIRVEAVYRTPIRIEEMIATRGVMNGRPVVLLAVQDRSGVGRYRRQKAKRRT